MMSGVFFDTLTAIYWFYLAAVPQSSERSSARAAFVPAMKPFAVQADHPV